jgi:hypothetical protein
MLSTADQLTPDTSADLPIWPSDIARFADGILEVTTGDGIRVAARDIIEIGVKPPRAGRLTMTLKYRAGLNKNGRKYWVQVDNEAALRRLVETVGAAAHSARSLFHEDEPRR